MTRVLAARATKLPDNDRLTQAVRRQIADTLDRARRAAGKSNRRGETTIRSRR